MVKNEPDKPDEIEAGTATEIQTEETTPPIEPAAEVVVSFDKINEILSEKQAAKDAEKAAEASKEMEIPASNKALEEKTARKGIPLESG